VDINIVKSEIDVLKKKLAETSELQIKDEIEFQMMQKFAVISNGIAALYPHRSTTMASLVGAVIQKDEAVCAGKAQIVTWLGRLCGFNADTVSVNYRTLEKDDVFESVAPSSRGIHEVTALEVPEGSKKLFIFDTNYPHASNQSPHLSEAIHLAYRLSRSDSQAQQLFTAFYEKSLVIADKETRRKEQIKLLKGQCFVYMPDGTLTIWKADDEESLPHINISFYRKDDSDIHYTNLALWLVRASLSQRNVQNRFGYLEKVKAEEYMNEAEYYLAKTLRQNPNGSGARATKGVVKMSKLFLADDWEQEDIMFQAIDAFESALKVNPDDVLTLEWAIDAINLYHQIRPELHFMFQDKLREYSTKLYRLQ
jgi:hypothetical protein